jgi:NADPH2:quinone reductase
MKAILMTQPGAPDVLVPTRVSEPSIKHDNEVKVRLHAAGVNPIDTKLRSRGTFQPDTLPTILGCDGAGEVVEVGKGVTRFKPGDDVWFCSGGLGGVSGSYAQYTLLEEDVARPKPAQISYQEAAAAPLVLITAWGALFDRGRLQTGKSVLIHAGAGGVGHVAIQLAKHAGAKVYTTVSNEEKADFVRQLGADEVINYEDHDFVDAINDLTDGRGVDLTLDTVGADTFRRSILATAHFGDLITLLDPGGDVVWAEARNRNLRIGFELMLTPMLRDLPEARAHHGEILDRCAELIDAGKLRIHVNQTLPLESAAQAHQLIHKGGMIGKLVLEIA